MSCNTLMKSFSFLWLSLLSSISVYAGNWHCDVVSLSEVLQKNPQISYLKCSDEISFEYEKLSIVEDHFLHPHQGVFNSTFILNVPLGQVVGQSGYVLVGDQLISELIWQNCFLHRDGLALAQQNPVQRIHGKVAVIAMFGYQYYYHWLVEALGRLALLELQGIEYDYLYVPYGKAYIQETLALWGIDSAKIIYGSDDVILQADELIVPSLVASVKTYGLPRLAHYMPGYLLKYIKNKLLSAVDFNNHELRFSKRVFISRKDSSIRRILNEDDVFALFEPKGFVRYELSSLSVFEQIELFHNADIIVGPLGSGSANVLFCKEGVRVFEIFQARRDCTIYYLCQTLGLSYYCTKTIDFIDENDGQYDSVIPLSIIEEMIKIL